MTLGTKLIAFQKLYLQDNDPKYTISLKFSLSLLYPHMYYMIVGLNILI